MTDGLRVLVLPPTGRDATLTGGVLTRAGIDSHVCSRVADLCAELQAGAGAIVVTDELAADSDAVRLAAAIRDQPHWSDLPVLLVSRGGVESPAAAFALEHFGNVAVLERPVRMPALVAAARTALRARRRQYQLRDEFRHRLDTAETLASQYRRLTDSERQLRQALDDLRDADRKKDEFLAMLAHELRNPLAPVRTTLHAMRLRAAPAGEDAADLAVMERQVGQMVRLIDDLLDVSRITRGKIELRRTAVELAPVVTLAVETSRPALDAAGHEFRVELPAERLVLDADAARLAQVLANLLTNAAKYTEPGGRIVLTAERDGAEVTVRVRDTGVGIPPEMLGKVFDMFAQVAADSDRSQGGLGLGLTLVKRLVEMHGGTVSAHSDGPGRGSEFVVRLPLSNREPDAPARASRPALAGASGSKVLVADDNADAANSLAKLLRAIGCDVRVVHDGPTALTMARDFRPDVALLDIGMPGMNGHEVARRLRAEGGLNATRLIALTGWGQDEDRKLSQAAGFDDHLVKPVDPVELLAALGRKT